MKFLNDDIKIFNFLNSLIKPRFKNRKYWSDWKQCLDQEGREIYNLWCFICDQKIMDAWTHDHSSAYEVISVIDQHILTHIPKNLITFI